ncbi:histidinol dehydrogenase, partial [Salmonella enterica subsp. enterica serovar Anatum]|nr:histidinol dehydrogenase [Salmonella enterica subsp. enterica serovar Anatum]
DGRLSWRRLAPALALIGFGLLCVNIAELSQGLSDVSGWRYGSVLATPARIAGCQNVVLCSPPPIADEILYAAQLCGVQEIFNVGG